MAHRLGRFPGGQPPRPRSAVQLGDPRRLAALQAPAQEGVEEVVVAVPASLQRDREEVAGEEAGHDLTGEAVAVVAAGEPESIPDRLQSGGQGPGPGR